MLDEGYAALTYRRVASNAGVTAAPLLRYYFRTIDDLPLALLDDVPGETCRSPKSLSQRTPIPLARHYGHATQTKPPRH